MKGKLVGFGGNVDKRNLAKYAKWRGISKCGRRNSECRIGPTLYGMHRTRRRMKAKGDGSPLETIGTADYRSEAGDLKFAWRNGPFIFWPCAAGRLGVYRLRPLTTFSGGEKSLGNRPRSFHARWRKVQRHLSGTEREKQGGFRTLKRLYWQT